MCPDETVAPVLPVDGPFARHYLQLQPNEALGQLTRAFRAISSLYLCAFVDQAKLASRGAVEWVGIILPVSSDDYEWRFGLHLLIGGFNAVIAFPPQWEGANERPLSIFVDSAVDPTELNAYLSALTVIMTANTTSA